MKNFNNNIKPLATRENIANKATFGFNNATIGLDATNLGLGATNLGFNNTSSLIKRRSYSNKSVLDNR